MDLLLDVDVIVDHCLDREPYVRDVERAIARCRLNGGRLWIYVGSVQTLESLTKQEITEKYRSQSRTASAEQITRRARERLQTFAEDKHWLSSLAGEGPVFASQDPKGEQLIRALDRFEPETIKLLTRDESLLGAYPDKTISPTAYCQRPTESGGLPFIDLKTQQDALRPQLERNLHRVLHHGQYILGPEVRELEEKLAAYTGAKHCITVASGTEALLISLMSLEVAPGDEVITTPFSFVATAEVIVLLGAMPVFVDIEPDTCNIDASLIEAKITPKTRAILPVGLYGQCADMDEINAIARAHRLPVIEDAAQSLGATYKGRKSGNPATFGCTSFFPSKPLGCYGDGGAIFTNDDELARACREIRIHGQSARYVHTRIGVGGRMDTLQCAILLAKLDHFHREVARRAEVGARYNALMDEAKIRRVRQRGDRTSVFAQYTFFADERETRQQRLGEAGIPTAVHYPVPLNEQPAYRRFATAGDTPIAHEAAKQVLSLPMHAALSEAEQRRIVDRLRARG